MMFACRILLIVLVLGWTSGLAAQPTITCLPHERGVMELVLKDSGFHTVVGRMGGFDPCEPKVQFRVPEGAPKPALMISVHGGSGVNDVLKSDEWFFKQGFATLRFEAYTMHGITGRDPSFWARSVTNEARQRMIYTTAVAAYRWAIQRSDIDNSRVYLYGISNGAAVVANLAAVVDHAHVKGIISEGVTPIGLGLPDEIRVPVMLAFGKLDDFGGPPKGSRSELSGDCRMNIEFPGVPPGTSQYCNMSTPGRPIPNALEWADAVQKRGGKVEVTHFEGMAHGAFLGGLNLRTATWANGVTLGASLGATDAARKTYFEAILDFIARHP